MKTVNTQSALIGNTPLRELVNYNSALHGKIYAKLESFNPGGSVKDRAVLFMLRDLLERGKVSAGGSVVEATSGNTGIALSYLAPALGLRAVIFMPESMSVERRKLMSAYGAELILTPASEGMSGAVAMAGDYLKEHKDAAFLGQFENFANVKAHEETTAKEILAQLGQAPDILVLGVGTGGTITGAGHALKKENPAMRVIAVEPAASPMITSGKKGAHKIQGIGAGFIPPILDLGIIDEVITVTDEEAFSYQRELALKEGIFAGLSSGAALCASVKTAENIENENMKIVTLFPDGGERYLSVI
ncbi:cysteine synthase A [Parelusimicrobium proximum]|uniref:cysteine synthase A n=1 Tax=Parelusimicrobium proximum TaxID=3228953 RepID=UPI003D175764